jgi:hypothetical protein
MKGRFDLGVSLMISVACAMTFSSGASAATFTLDFESAATGNTLLSSPLLTPLGTITFSQTTSCGAPISLNTSIVGSGTGLCTNSAGGTTIATLSFDFSVPTRSSSILDCAQAATFTQRFLTVPPRFSDQTLRSATRVQ